MEFAYLFSVWSLPSMMILRFLPLSRRLLPDFHHMMMTNPRFFPVSSFLSVRPVAHPSSFLQFPLLPTFRRSDFSLRLCLLASSLSSRFVLCLCFYAAFRTSTYFAAG